MNDILFNVECSKYLKMNENLLVDFIKEEKARDIRFGVNEFGIQIMTQAILPNSVLSFSILDLSEQSRNSVPA